MKRRRELDPLLCRIDHDRAWIVSAPSRPIPFAAAFRVLLSDRAVVAIEGISISDDVKQILQAHVVEPTLQIRPGTVFPQTEWLHIRATAEALSAIDELVNTHADPEICNHLYAYVNGMLLLQWHDAFSDPIHVNGIVSPPLIATFCRALGVGPAKPPSLSHE